MSERHIDGLSAEAAAWFYQHHVPRFTNTTTRCLLFFRWEGESACPGSLLVLWTNDFLNSPHVSLHEQSLSLIMLRNPTEEEKVQQAQRWEDQFLAERERRLAVHHEGETSRARAQALLRSHLTAAQQRDLQAEGYFLVTGEASRDPYRIYQGQVKNVTRLHPLTGQPMRSFCTLPRDEMPSEDVMLTQKVLLESNEEAFLREANSWEAL